MTVMTATEVRKFRAGKLAEIRREFADIGLKPEMRLVGNAIMIGTHWSISMTPTGLCLHGDNKRGVGIYKGMGDAETLVLAIVDQVISQYGCPRSSDFVEHRIDTADIKRLIERKLTSRTHILALIERRYKDEVKEIKHLEYICQPTQIYTIPLLIIVPAVS
jgi:hypothetical protein